MRPDIESTDHYWRALNEQMLIVSQCRATAQEANLEFIQVHALAIVQLCNQIMSLETSASGPRDAKGPEYRS